MLSPIEGRPFWQGRRVLVTGHTGFKGSWLSLWLDSMGAEVVGYALVPPTEPSLFELARIGDTITSLEGDVRDLGDLDRVIQRHRPQVIFHMAAQAMVQRSYADPVETYSTNMMGTVNVLDAARRCESLEAVVVVTSDKCYENLEVARGYHEEDLMGGRDPYSSSKGCAELIVSAYRRTYFAAPSDAAVASVRAGNVIGGGDWAVARLVPDVMRAAVAGRPVEIRRPEAVRPWQHVLEALSGYLLLAERLCGEGKAFAEGWNFGPDEADAQPVRYVVERLAECWGDDFRWELDGRDHPHEANFLRLDSTKARRRLGWAPRLPLDTALEWTAAWYRAFRDGSDLRRATLDQIEEYMTLAPATERPATPGTS